MTDRDTPEKIDIKHFTRWGMGNSYNETCYYCPSCGYMMAYHNGVTWMEDKLFGMHYCPNCGQALYWPDEE